MASGSKPRQIDIFGNEVEYQFNPGAGEPARKAGRKAPPVAAKFFVFFVRSVPPAYKPLTRDQRAGSHPPTKRTPEEWGKGISWGKGGEFATEDEGRAAAIEIVKQAQAFFAGVWKTYRRGDSDPVFTVRWRGRQ